MTEENIKKDEPVELELKISHPKNDKNKILFEVSGLNRSATFDFTNETDAETAFRFGGILMNCFSDIAKLKADVLDVVADEDEEMQESPDNPV